MRLFFPSAHTLPAPPPHAPPWVTHLLNLRRRRQWQPPSTELPALAPPLRLRSRAPRNQSTTASFAALTTNQRRCHHDTQIPNLSSSAVQKPPQQLWPYFAWQSQVKWLSLLLLFFFIFYIYFSYFFKSRKTKWCENKSKMEIKIKRKIK